ncbi:MAG TPA: nucleotidyltransferase domain-containing protein [Jatrophihabitans sp.]|nr:nucleotidyltransferase domain-containing protein [Jatrophihabitans sp.]
MYTETERGELRNALLAAGQEDARISAAAIVGSAARGAEDAWSDIDLAFRLAAGLTPEDVVGDWTSRMYGEHGAVAHTDVRAGPALYRVFLIANSLQVDVSFWPAEHFASTGEAFQLVFGAANEPRPARPPDPHALIGTAWLYALHARSSIARRRHLQALYMINNVRDQVIVLAALRHDVPSAHARGADELPSDVKADLAETVVFRLGQSELRRAFERVVAALLVEARHIDDGLATALASPLRELVRTARPIPRPPTGTPRSAERPADPSPPG